MSGTSSFNALGGMVFNLLIYGLMAVISGYDHGRPYSGFNFATLPLSLISMMLAMFINFFFS